MTDDFLVAGAPMRAEQGRTWRPDGIFLLVRRRGCVACSESWNSVLHAIGVMQP